MKPGGFWGILIGAVLLLGGLAAAQAEPVHIVALGASNVAGRGVGAAQAWPAHLAQMLRQKGYDVAMTVSAVNGETSSATAARAAGAIQPGTRVVVYLLSTRNDARKLGADHSAASARRIDQIARARGATPVHVSFEGLLGRPKVGNPSYQADGHHLTAQSHARFAASMLPRVIAAIGQKKS